MAEKSSPEDELKDVRSYRPNLPRRERLAKWDQRAQIIHNGKPLKYDCLYISILPQDDWKFGSYYERIKVEKEEMEELRKKYKWDKVKVKDDF